MKIPTIKNLYLALVVLTCGLMIAACSPEKSTSKDDFEKQVEAYIQKFPYQETYRYAMLQTGGGSGQAEHLGQYATRPAQGR